MMQGCMSDRQANKQRDVAVQTEETTLQGLLAKALERNERMQSKLLDVEESVRLLLERNGALQERIADIRKVHWWSNVFR